MHFFTSVHSRFFPFRTLLFNITRENDIFAAIINAKNVMSIKRFIDRPPPSIVINVMVVAVGNCVLRICRQQEIFFSTPSITIHAPFGKILNNHKKSSTSQMVWRIFSYICAA